MMKSYLLAIVLSMILLTVLNRFLSEKNKCENKIKWQHTKNNPDIKTQPRI